ncbi:hypothetical protein ACERK3_17345 [Phycisphaerales bacterium AB-hyl4]|uniref:Uncharacterized protein n=1 Tax=Natronomicrosphaera hydrolytica TaxID=3242702 RepID=A0ABV4UAX1_9BACT
MVNDDGAIALASTKCEVVDADDAARMPHCQRQGAKLAQDRVAAGVDAEFAAQPPVWFAIAFRTLKLRNLSPTETIAHALRHLLQHGYLPPLPEQAVAGG